MNENALGKLYTLKLIQNDSETLKQICQSIWNPVFSMCIIPYLALFCRSVQECLNVSIVSPEIETEIYDIRNGIKIFGEKYGKGRKRFLDSDEKQNEESRDMLRFEFTKSLNIHYNLGIYFDTYKHVVGNTQLLADMLNLNGLPKNEQADKSFNLAYNLGGMIGKVTGVFSALAPIEPIHINAELPDFYFADLNTNTTSLFNPAFEKDTSLFMLHLLSNLGFVTYFLEPVVGSSNPWMLRIKYIMTYYSYLGLRRLKQHLENNVQNGTELFINSAEQILTEGDGLFASKFRNCMMHYDLLHEGQFAISESNLNNELKLFGLVEECFNGHTYEEFYESISSLAHRIEECLVGQFDFQRVHIKKLSHERG